MTWRLARSLQTLRDEVDDLAPGRSKASDGAIGDQAHQAGASDHNPNDAGVVCAIDLTHDPDAGADMHRIADYLSEHPHRDLKYLIWNRRIWSKARRGEGWRGYHGSNPHTVHMHVSAGRGSDGHSRQPYDDTSPWGLANLTGGSADMIGLSRGDSGERVKGLQATLRYAGFDPGEVDGDYGPKTAAAVLAMRRSQGSEARDGDHFTGWAYAQLMKALTKVNGRGDGRGDLDALVAAAVADYLIAHPPADGADGVLELPVDVAITGRLTQVTE